MQIDRASLEKLLCLNDRQLKAVIQSLIVQSGLDPAQFHIDPQDVQSIRRALGSATDADLKKIAEQYEANHRRGG